MHGRGIELILMRQLASCLSMPILLSDGRGELVYVNEPAEQLLGITVGDSDTLSMQELADQLSMRGGNGAPLSHDELPNRAALLSGRVVQRRVQVRASDGRNLWLDATVFPLISPVGESVGIVSLYWEVPDEG